MKQLIELIVKELVDYPDKVNLIEVDGERTTALELRVAKSDLGKVIGRHGKTAGAIRTILGTVAARTGRKAVLEILE